MQTKIIDGRKIRDQILEQLKDDISKLPFRPKFCDVLVGNDGASAQYVRMKNKTAEALGIETIPAVLPENATTEEVIEKVRELNIIPGMSGLIVQLPLPKHIDKDRVLAEIDPRIDVDCINPNQAKIFYEGGETLVFPTARAVIEILGKEISDLSEKRVIVVGKGELVGRPVSELLKRKGINSIIVDRSTENPDEVIRSADVIVTAVGKTGIVRSDNIKEGVVIVDAGTSESSGAIVGDVDSKTVLDIASAISPVPGGVGPVTVAMLFDNLVTVARQK